jgi:hypothetical protein
VAVKVGASLEHLLRDHVSAQNARVRSQPRSGRRDRGNDLGTVKGRFAPRRD